MGGMTTFLLSDFSLQFVLLCIAVPDLLVAGICLVLAYCGRRQPKALCVHKSFDDDIAY